MTISEWYTCAVFFSNGSLEKMRQQEHFIISRQQIRGYFLIFIILEVYRWREQCHHFLLAKIYIWFSWRLPIPLQTKCQIDQRLLRLVWKFWSNDKINRTLEFRNSFFFCLSVPESFYIHFVNDSRHLVSLCSHSFWHFSQDIAASLGSMVYLSLCR